MQPRLLDVLCCPACRGELGVTAFETAADGRVVQGLLRCLCGEAFPIIDSVARLLLGGLRRALLPRHREFFNRFPALAAAWVASKDEPDAAPELRTSESFGYEWTEFSKYDVDNFSPFIKPLGEGFFKGKFGLDVGCGAGRHAGRAAALGAEIVGVDLSHAIDVAARAHRHARSTHFVQADIGRLPFRAGAFDFIYSLGVLHHLPDPPRGFAVLPRHLKPDGALFIWVYQRTLRKKILEGARAVTTRLPLRVVKGLSWAAAAVDYGLGANLYRALSRFEIVRRWTPSRVKEYAGYGFYVSAADWFDRLSAPISHCYSEADVRGWLDGSALADVETALVDDSWVWGFGRKR